MTLNRYSLTTIIAITASSAFLNACAQTGPAPLPGDDPLVISQATEDALQKYLSLIYPNKRGAFAVSADGANSYTFYCPEISCSPSLFGTPAVRQCESLSAQPCHLLYTAQSPRLAYTVSPSQGSAGRHGIKRGIPTEELPVVNE